MYDEEEKKNYTQLLKYTSLAGHRRAKYSSVFLGTAPDDLCSTGEGPSGANCSTGNFPTEPGSMCVSVGGTPTGNCNPTGNNPAGGSFCISGGGK